jgi:hypothetical protein
MGGGCLSGLRTGGEGDPRSYFGEGGGYPPLIFWTGYHPPSGFRMPGVLFRRDSTGSRGCEGANGVGGACLAQERGVGDTSLKKNSRKLLNSGWSEPFFVCAVKIHIEADEHQIKFFRNNILVGIIEIEPERCCHLFNPHDILTT